MKHYKQLICEQRYQISGLKYSSTRRCATQNRLQVLHFEVEFAEKHIKDYRKLESSDKA